jgi:alpha-1,3-mannosyltransferase
MSAVEAKTVPFEPQAGAAPLIVHVVRQFLPNRGGLEDVVANLCRQSMKRGLRVRVVTCDSLFSAPGEKLAPREIVEDIEIVRIPWSGSTRYPFAPQVFRHIADADLVHVHAVDFFFDALAWGRLLHRRPMVATTHGGFFHTRKFAALKKVWFRTLTRLSAGAYRTVICCSASDLRQFAEIAPQRVPLIENGADIGKFAGAAAREPLRRIVTIGRFSLNKRLDRLLDAVAALQARGGGWHLDIIGVPSDLTGADLEREIAARGLAKAVTLHVSPENAAIREILSRASLFASASEYEGFGIVAVEAMSAGLLPVLNANEAFVTLGKRHRMLRIADFARPEAAAEALADAHAALTQEADVSRARLMREASAYSWETVAERYFEVYAGIIALPDQAPSQRGQLR